MAAEAGVFYFLDRDQRDPLIVPVSISRQPATKNVGGPLGRQILVVIEEAFLDLLSKRQALQQGMRRLPLGGEEVGGIELVGCVSCSCFT
jgi:hypothetical protein